MPEPRRPPGSPETPPLPFPDSLCHRCGAPPQYVRTARSVFILCPLRPDRYPRQPVLECRWYRPRPVVPES